MPKFRRISIGNTSNCYADVVIMDRYSNSLVFASMVGYAGAMPGICHELNKNNNVYVEDCGYCRTSGKKYDVVRKKQNNSDFMHAVITKKDELRTENNDEILFCYIFYRNTEDRNNAIYDKLYKHTAVPILKEWMPYIITEFERQQLLRNTIVYYDNSNDKPQSIFCQSMNISQSNLVTIVSTGLATGQLSVNNSNTTSEDMIHINGLDSYLNTFAEILASKIQESFVPKFTPGQDSYSEKLLNFDDNCFYNANIDLYEAQLATIQSMVNNLNTNDVGFVIGEMGAGKTALGAGITYVHHKKKTGLTSLILCPSHLTNKWKREVERLVPNGAGYVIHNLKDLLKIDSKIRDKNRKENMYIIMSKETAKFGYEMRPSALWSDSKNCFVCPECGQPLTKKVFVGSGRHRHAQNVRLTERDMNKPYAHNQVCDSEIKIINKHGLEEEVPCGTKLWVPLNGADTNGWIKLGTEGWIKQNHMDSLFEKLTSVSDLSRSDTTFLGKLADKIAELATGKNVVRAPRKYPVSKYIKKYYKGCIDYLLCDEMELRLTA